MKYTLDLIKGGIIFLIACTLGLVLGTIIAALGISVYEATETGKTFLETFLDVLSRSYGFLDMVNLVYTRGL